MLSDTGQVLSRRHAFQALALGGLAAPNARPDEGKLTTGDIRATAALAGLDLTEERARILLPVLENRRRQLRELRAIRIGDDVRPHLPADH